MESLRVDGSDVEGGSIVGGLVGYMPNGSLVENSYATGGVTAGMTRAGGLIGCKGATASVVSSYRNTQTTGQGTSAGGTGEVGLLRPPREI